MLGTGMCWLPLITSSANTRGRHICCRRFRRIPQSCSDIDKLHLPKASVAALSNIPVGSTSWRLRRGRRRRQAEVVCKHKRANECQVVYANYINGINAMEGHGIRTVPPSPTATAGIFCTYPQAFMTKTSQFFSEFIASAILMFVIFALKDDSNNGVSKSGGNWFPLALFFLIFGLGAW